MTPKEEMYVSLLEETNRKYELEQHRMEKLIDYQKGLIIEMKYKLSCLNSKDIRAIMMNHASIQKYLRTKFPFESPYRLLLSKTSLKYLEEQVKLNRFNENQGMKSRIELYCKQIIRDTINVQKSIPTLQAKRMELISKAQKKYKIHDANH
jgi:hypothetical protein